MQMVVYMIRKVKKQSLEEEKEEEDEEVVTRQTKQKVFADLAKSAKEQRTDENLNCGRN